MVTVLQYLAAKRRWTQHTGGQQSCSRGIPGLSRKLWLGRRLWNALLGGSGAVTPVMAGLADGDDGRATPPSAGEVGISEITRRLNAGRDQCAAAKRAGGREGRASQVEQTLSPEKYSPGT